MAFGTAIQNIGDFYSAHYLESTFEKDLKEIKERWKTAGSASPAKRLQALAQEYFRAKAEALEETDPVKRLVRISNYELLGHWHAKVLAALGYDIAPGAFAIDGGHAVVPTLAEVRRFEKPWLVIAETPFCCPEASIQDGLPLDEPLELCPQRVQFVDKGVGEKCFSDTWGKAIGKIFMDEEPPRWLMLISGSMILLFDREKYAQGRYLLFDLDDLFSRKEADTNLASAALLARETLCPDAETGAVLHDSLEENSHKFAYGVSDALQFAVREAIECLVNEWVEDRRRRKLSYTNVVVDGQAREISAEDLRHEALVYVYRLLFCFFAEARGGELGILPITEEAYRLGYSLEALRDLENVPLSEEAREGFYFNEHLTRLFELIRGGFNPEGSPAKDQQILFNAPLRSFQIRPLTATLFDAKATPLLSGARLRNSCLQRVIRSLSLSTHESTGSIGRVNYAELGINQLGAVYEGLLSYKGMFADRDLIQVKNKDEDIRDKKTASWFVPKERLAEFHRDEVVRTQNDLERIYKQGEFILHLSGIDRERSASYYTPEVLTKALVEEALRELLKDYTPADADKILELKICEPAMGSGAFLNEATDQLAQRYLELKSKQIGREIDVVRLPEERRRVKHYLGCRNVYGVDLNPTAVELGSLSLWLGTIHRLRATFETDNGEEERFNMSATPWFGLRLRAGNSIIGARRCVWSDEDLRKGRHVGSNGHIPRLLKPGESRKPNEIYHFLVFDEDMLPSAGEALIKKYHRDECDVVKKWKQKQVTPKWDEHHICELLELSALIDQHWEEYATKRKAALLKTACTATVWPEPADSDASLKESPDLEYQERVKAELESNSGGFQRLKLVMDAWCALWFYPVMEAERLPTRENWIATLQALFCIKASSKEARAGLSMRLGFDLELLLRASQAEVPDADAIANAVPWLKNCRSCAEAQNFFHWELSFPEVLSEFGDKGFDLVLGNPPWIKVVWEDAVFLSEFSPILGVRKAPADAFAPVLRALGGQPEHLENFLKAKASATGTAKILGSQRYYSVLQGGQANTFKNFICLGWSVNGSAGIVALLHPDTIFEESGAGALRSEMYLRLCSHYQFRNQLMLFKDIPHRQEFCVNVYSEKKACLSFVSMASLFHPRTIAASYDSCDGRRPVPGLKTNEGEWNTVGHSSRLVVLVEEDIRGLAPLFGEDQAGEVGSPLPRVYCREFLNVFRQVCNFKSRLSDLKDGVFHTEMLHESNSIRDGVLFRCENPTFQPVDPGEVVLSGPHFFVGNPFYQTTRRVYGSKASYDLVDLQEAPCAYLPRCLFRPGDGKGCTANYQHAIVRTAAHRKVTDYYRFINRGMLSKGAERSLDVAVIPKGFSHINGADSLAFEDYGALMLFASSSFSLIFDFVLRETGKANCSFDVLGRFPLLETSYADAMRFRGLRLVCLGDYFSELWRVVAKSPIRSESWASNKSPLQSCGDLPWASISHTDYRRGYGLRADVSRRQALLELDVLVALALNISLTELCAIYRLSFPVLLSREQVDEYDANGSLLPNTARKRPGAYELQRLRAEHGDDKPLTVTWKIDDGAKEVTKTFYPPFVKFDREEDYAEAYEFFQKRYGGGA